MLLHHAILHALLKREHNDKRQETAMKQTMNQQYAKTGTTRAALLFAFSDALLTHTLRDRSLRSSLFSPLMTTDSRTSIIRGGNTPS